MDKFIATANIKKKEFLDNRERENPIIEVTLGDFDKKEENNSNYYISFKSPDIWYMLKIGVPMNIHLYYNNKYDSYFLTDSDKPKDPDNTKELKLLSINYNKQNDELVIVFEIAKNSEDEKKYYGDGDDFLTQDYIVKCTARSVNADELCPGSGSLIREFKVFDFTTVNNTDNKKQFIIGAIVTKIIHTMETGVDISLIIQLKLNKDISRKYSEFYIGVGGNDLVQFAGKKEIENYSVEEQNNSIDSLTINLDNITDENFWKQQSEFMNGLLEIALSLSATVEGNICRALVSAKCNK